MPAVISDTGPLNYLILIEADVDSSAALHVRFDPLRGHGRAFTWESSRSRPCRGRQPSAMVESGEDQVYNRHGNFLLARAKSSRARWKNRD
jgi:hypothetical protein